MSIIRAVFIILFFIVGMSSSCINFESSSNGNSDEDVHSPSPGNDGHVLINIVNSSTVTLEWTRASDEVSLQDELQYCLYILDEERLEHP